MEKDQGVLQDRGGGEVQPAAKAGLGQQAQSSNGAQLCIASFKPGFEFWLVVLLLSLRL